MVTTTGWPSGPETSNPNTAAYLRPNWKTCPSSMPLDSRRAARHLGQGSPLRISTAPISPAGAEYRPGTVGAGHPRRAFGDHGVDQVGDAERSQELGPDVARDQVEVLRQVLGLGDGDRCGFELRRHPLQIHLAIARD